MTTSAQSSAAASEVVSSSPEALAGIRVLDFTWSVAGPTITTILAAFGAEVIKVEWPARFDSMRTVMVAADVPPTLDSACFFAAVNPGKRGFSVNTRLPAGMALIEALIEQVDVVTESFSAGVLERWGLGYERMRELNPEIIYLSFSGFGHSGPYTSYDTWGPTAQSFNGMTGYSGLPGDGPAGIGFSYLDVMGGYHGALAALLAIYHKRATGHGQYVDVAQTEAGLAFTGAGFLDASVNLRGGGRIGVPPGNRAVWPGAAAAAGLRGEVGAPYNCYPARGDGDGDYCAITVLTDAQWEGFKDALGRPAWAQEGQFATVAARIANQDELDAAVAAWTSTRDKWEIMRVLQQHGVPAGPVQTFEEIVETDPQLRHRGFFVEGTHPLLGRHRWESSAVKLSESPSRLHERWPLLGQDNDYVLGDVLKVDPERRAQLEEEGVFWPPDLPRVVSLEGGSW
jgi:crotonobetainyl-CoA:carnitine CoA-transferase CaiB-like acyl-CoA transferase